MCSVYYETLISEVIQNSYSKSWTSAVNEWDVADCEEDDSLESSCICGKENLRYLFTIRNIINGNILFPIGSTCIKKFNRSELNDVVSINEGLFKLLHAIESNQFINLTSDFFSRKLLKHLFDSGAFLPTEYNNFSAQNDFDFILKMFNKRDKSTITPKQQKKIRAIIIAQIRPYLHSILEDKIKKN